MGKFGSIRKLNGMIYFDFYYLGERVREPYGLPWDGIKKANVLAAREALDLIGKGIKMEKFIFSEFFPRSKHKENFTKLEIEQNNRNHRPTEVKIKDYIPVWLEDLRNGDTTGRTINGYKSNNALYIIPYWGELTFDDLKKSNLPKFYKWARKQKYKKMAVSNNSLNKYVSQLRRIGTHAADKYGWDNYLAFGGYKKLKGKFPFEDIDPFSLSEQEKFLRTVHPYWRPYVDFAFSSGLSPGEQDALFTLHVDMQRKTVSVIQAVTLDEDGNKVIDGPKNEFRNRTIKMNNRMLSAVKAQLRLRKKFNIVSESFFCMPDGDLVNRSWLTKNIWKPALKAAHVKYRPLKQSRHTYAILHRSKGEDPLEIAKTMGHCDTIMLEKVYTKYKEKIVGLKVGDEEILRSMDFGLDEIDDLSDCQVPRVKKSKVR